MADLNNGKGKFWGVDENVLYADSFVGATKVAEKVKKGGTESKPDGYVVDAIDIDWGGLKLTTIDNGWSQKTVSSTEQNAGKGENTQGIHSTAYLLNLISSSFTQIYTQIGGSDNAGLRKKIKDLESSIKDITGSDPGQLADIRTRIQQIEKELSNPGATNTMISILDTLDGFDKDKKGDVKKYIDDHDKAILGTATDSATTYSVYGVRKYVDTTAKENLIGTSTDAATADTIWGAKNYATTVQSSLLGASGDAWPTKQTLYGVVKYSDTKNADLKKNLIGTSTDTTIDTHWGLKHILIGNTADTTINTHWGVKNSLIGTDSDTKDSNTIKGAKKYADNVKTNLIGTSTDTTINTHYGLKNILIGTSYDAMTADTIWGAKNYAVAKDVEVVDFLIGNTADTTINSHWGIKNSLIGKDSDASTADTIWGAKKAAADVMNNIIGDESTDTPNSYTIWGVRKYADKKDGDLKTSLIGASTDTTIDTHYGLKHILIGNTADTTIDTHWGVKNSLIGTENDNKDSNTIKGAKKYADNVQSKLIGTSTDTTIKTHYGLKHILIGNTADTTIDTHYGLKHILIGTASDHDDFDTIWGAKNYAKYQISVKKYNQLTAQVIEENGEGILELSTVSSYLG